MNPSIYRVYKLKIEQISENKSLLKEVYNSKLKINKFSHPANNKKAKLYIIKSGNEIVYVGITSQPIATRLRQGLNPYLKKGYHGYKWKHLKKVSLLIWCGSGYDKATKEELRDAETIEGEVVYLVRKLTDKWPKYQNEIHFHNGNQRQIETAVRIFLIASKNKDA